MDDDRSRRASRTFGWFSRVFRRSEAGAAEPAATAAARIARLEALNSLLHRVASSPNVTALFDVLSSRMGEVVPCDRIAVALTDAGPEFQMVVARSTTSNSTKAAEPLQVHHFLRASTIVAEVADHGEPRNVSNITAFTATHLDANVLASSGFQSAAMLPLRTEGVTLGVLVILSRKESTYTDDQLETLRPIADIVAVSFATQSLARALGRMQMAKDMAEVMFSLSNEINSALQAIASHCELLWREYEDPALRRDLAMVERQAQRATDGLAEIQRIAESRLQRAGIANLLEDARFEETATSRAMADPGFVDLFKR